VYSRWCSSSSGSGAGTKSGWLAGKKRARLIWPRLGSALAQNVRVARKEKVAGTARLRVGCVDGIAVSCDGD
jgi:hypothetical protein